MSVRKPPDDEILFLDDDEGGDEVARALAEAERAVEAVEQRHRHPVRVAEPVLEFDADAAMADAAADAAEGDRNQAELESKVAALTQAFEVEKERATTAEEENGRLREALVRKSADFDNLKRRTEREKTDFFKFALAETFRDLLGILDNLGRALAHVKDETEAASSEDFRVGIEMIARQFADALKKYGLSEVPAEGLPFNPNFHEAVVREETDAVAPGTILEVLQKGYILNERLLRPALVKVAGARPQGDA